MAPAKASPNESPNEPPAEFTPAASLTRSSQTGNRNTICRKIGTVIIRPPSAICCSICPVIPNRKRFARKRPGSKSAGLALLLSPR